MIVRMVIFVLLLISSFVSAPAQAIFPIENNFPAYQSTDGCGSICSYQPVRSVSGDFNGDNKLDFAYIEVPNYITSGVTSPSDYLVVVFGQSSGVPQQVATALTGCSPTAVAAKDMNQDKKIDVVLLCSQGFDETLLGNGDGTFQPPILSAVPANASALTLADFNGDELQDIAFALSGGYAISLNQGNGHFTSPITHNLNSSVTGITAGDFNGDRKQDLVFGSGYVLGNGDGTFQSEQPLPPGILNFAVADYNQDGYADLVCSVSENSGSTQFPLYLIKGSSSGLSSQSAPVSENGFARATLQTVGPDSSGSVNVFAFLQQNENATLTNGFAVLAPDGAGSFYPPIGWANVNAFAIADVNGDGIPELIGTDFSGSSSSFTVVAGTNDGIFRGVPLTIAPASMAVIADINGDGLPDAVRSGNGSGAPQVYLSTGNGRFVPAPIPATAGSTDNGSLLVAADFSGDSLTDVVSIYPGYPQCRSCSASPSQISFYRGKGDGTLTFLNTFSLQVSNVTGVISGDFNRDDKQDLVLIYSSGEGGALFLPGNGNGTFGTPTHVALLGNDPFAIAIADLNGDGISDFVIADGSGTVISYLGIGDGSFSGVSQILSVAAANIAVTDVTGDGIPDLICLTSNNALQVYSGMGSGKFSTAAVFTASPVATGARSLQVQTGDVNGDGLSDLAVSYIDAANQGRLALFLSQGAGNFTFDSNRYAAVPGPSTGLFLTKLNQKGSSSGIRQYLDALISSGSGLASLLNQNNPSPLASTNLTLALVNRPVQIVRGETLTVTSALTGIAGSGSPSGTITFYLNGKAVDNVAVSQGQASAQVTITQDGPVTISASYSGNATYAESTAFLTLIALQSTTTSLSTGGSSVPQGIAVTFTAAVSPATATGTVRFQDGTTDLGTGAVSSGVATFTTSNLSAGVHSIRASYSGDSLNAPSTSPVFSLNITPATLQLSSNSSSLSIVQGSSGSINITATSVGSYTGKVTFACSGLPAYSTCTFSPSTLTFDSSSQAKQTTTVTLSTNVSEAQAMLTGGLGPLRYLLILPSVFLIGFSRRSRLGDSLFAFVLVVGTLVLWGCGEGPRKNTSSQVTPVGTSTVTITATGSNSSTNLTVNVTQ